MFTFKNTLNLLRYSVGVTFIWFGVLKLFNSSSSLEIITSSLQSPLAHSQILIFAISLLELLIGVGILLKHTIRFTIIIMIIYLLTLTLVTIKAHGFDPRFPVLSLGGEFALKNIVYIAAGLVLLSDKGNNIDEKTKKEDKEK